jgi:hypothetical protein
MHRYGDEETIIVMHIHRYFTAVLAVGAATLAAASFATASTRLHQAATAVTPTKAALGTVRGSVEQWLAGAGFKGFHVSEVMVFSNNDYVAVDGTNGKPAFELLTSPSVNWVMEEPASMMWNTKYGMLRGTGTTLEPVPGLSMMWGGMMRGSPGMMGSPSNWYGSGTGKVTSLAQAVIVANGWLAQIHSGQKVETDGRAFPGYFTLDTTLNGKTYGMLSVNDTTGTVWYHGWHGTFLGERQFSL